MKNIIDCSNHSLKKRNIDFFQHLINIALADDNISNSEMELLVRIGNRLGITDIEINNLIFGSKNTDYIPPYELAERFEQVYEIAKMVMINGEIGNNEIHLAIGFAAKSRFNEKEIPDLIDRLINGIKEGKDEEILFKEYKKDLSFRDTKNSNT